MYRVPQYVLKFVVIMIYIQRMKLASFGKSCNVIRFEAFRTHIVLLY
jgi:hypothetical protein